VGPQEGKARKLGQTTSQHERQRENEKFETDIKEGRHLTTRKQYPSTSSSVQSFVLPPCSLFENYNYYGE
jgi:hypothetical protein